MRSGRMHEAEALLSVSGEIRDGGGEASRRLGFDRELVRIDDDDFDAADAEIIELFEGRDDSPGT